MLFDQIRKKKFGQMSKKGVRFKGNFFREATQRVSMGGGGGYLAVDD